MKQVQIRTIFLSKIFVHFNDVLEEPLVIPNIKQKTLEIRIPPKYEKLSDQFVYWVIDVLLH